MAQRTSGIGTRRFGVEIEVVAPVSCGYAQRLAVDAALAALASAGVEARFEGYSHETRPHWKVVTDGSISGAAAGVEIVSPPMSGEEGIAEVARVAQALAAAGFTANRSCGLHVHVDAMDLTPEQIRRAFAAYAIGERGFDAMVAPSRRGSVNPYCQSIPRMVAYRAGCESEWTQASARRIASWIKGYATVLDLARAVGTRYCKVNLEALNRHGTIEFRQHHGTTNHEKITSWVRLMVGLVNHAAGARRDARVRERDWSAAENSRWFQVRRALRLAGATPELAAWWMARANALAKAERRARTVANRRQAQRARRLRAASAAMVARCRADIAARTGQNPRIATAGSTSGFDPAGRVAAARAAHAAAESVERAIYAEDGPRAAIGEGA